MMFRGMYRYQEYTYLNWCVKDGYSKVIIFIKLPVIVLNHKKAVYIYYYTDIFTSV